MKCAYCGGGNAEESQNCRTCGTPLTKEAAAAQAPPAFSPEAKRLMTRGALWFGGGVLITVITYSAASGGGTYVVAWGAMIVGAVNFFRGLTARNKFTQSSNPMETIVEPSPDPQELLDSAARLESVNREQAVAKYQEIIKGFPGTRESEEAQRNIRLLTSHREE